MAENTFQISRSPDVGNSGAKRFDGKAYLLVVLANGEVRSGKVYPIEDVGAWMARIDELRSPVR